MSALRPLRVGRSRKWRRQMRPAPTHRNRSGRQSALRRSVAIPLFQSLAARANRQARPRSHHRSATFSRHKSECFGRLRAGRGITRSLKLGDPLGCRLALVHRKRFRPWLLRSFVGNRNRDQCPARGLMAATERPAAAQGASRDTQFSRSNPNTGACAASYQLFAARTNR